MRHLLATPIALAILCSILLPRGQFQTASADVTWTGDIDPTDPTMWTQLTTGYIGKVADGTLAVHGGHDLLSSNGFIGYEIGAAGDVTVTGPGSTWTPRHRRIGQWNAECHGGWRGKQ